MIPTLGRIVHYRLSAEDAARVMRRRTTGASIRAQMADPDHGWPAGAQAHVGNDVAIGDTFPMLLVRVWEDSDAVSGQVFLDGSDVLWVTGVPVGTGPGSWAWPPH